MLAALSTAHVADFHHQLLRPSLIVVTPSIVLEPRSITASSNSDFIDFRHEIDPVRLVHSVPRRRSDFFEVFFVSLVDWQSDLLPRTAAAHGADGAAVSRLENVRRQEAALPPRRGAGGIRTADGRRISVPKKYYPKSKQRQRKLVLDRQEQYKWHNFPIHI